MKLTVPGRPGNGTNPEQLFAAGWSACFLSAIKLVGAKMKVTIPPNVAVDPEVDLLTGDDGYFLKARLNVSLPGLDHEIAQAVCTPRTKHARTRKLRVGISRSPLT